MNTKLNPNNSLNIKNTKKIFLFFCIFLFLVFMFVSKNIYAQDASHKQLDISSLNSLNSNVKNMNQNNQESALPGFSRPGSLILGVDYGLISPAISAPLTPNKYLFVFFAFSDPRAEQLMDVFSSWRTGLNSNVRIRFSPIIINNSTTDIFGARVFFALQLLGESELNQTLLEAMLKGQTTITNPKNLSNWLENNQINLNQFKKALNSNTDIALTNQVINTQNAYNITSSPTIAICNKYIVRWPRDSNPQTMLTTAKALLNFCGVNDQQN